MIRGSGCPQLKGVLINRLEMKPKTELPLKFGSVILMNGLGLSAGSAGPAVQLGAYFGQLILKDRKNNDFLLCCGVTALAVLYGVPMAAIAFAIEEYQLKLKQELFLSLGIIMSVALSVRYLLFGFAPALDFEMAHYLNWQGLAMLFGVSVIIGILFKYSQLWLGKLYRWKPLILLPFILTFYFSLKMPQILGGGLALFSFLDAQGASLLLKTAAVLLIGKILFSLVCLSSAVPAGVFLPTFAIGGMLGSVIGLFTLTYLSESILAYNSYIVLGIALMTTVILRRPFTAALLAVELTGNFGWTPYVLMTALIMDELLKRTGDRPLNEVLLDKLLDEDVTLDY